MHAPACQITGIIRFLQRNSSAPSHRRFWALLTAAGLVLTQFSCTTGGGRFQDKMGSGKSMFENEVRIVTWPAPGNERTGPVQLTCCHWLPKGRPKAVVIAVPGLDESCNEWHPLATHLARCGYEVHASDLRGQGKDCASGDRGNFSDWKCWVKDVQDFRQHVLKRRRLPVAYVGQSLGAMVALTATATARSGTAPDALVLQGPAFIFAYPPAILPPLTTATKLLTLNQLRMTTPVALQLADTMIVSNCRDEASWETSPDRVREGITLRYIQGCFQLGRRVRLHLPDLKIPVLMQYGCADLQVRKTRRTPCEIMERIGSNDTCLWWHPDPAASHDMQLDTALRGPALEKTASWLDQRLFAKH